MAGRTIADDDDNGDTARDARVHSCALMRARTCARACVRACTALIKSLSALPRSSPEQWWTGRKAISVASVGVGWGRGYGGRGTLTRALTRDVQTRRTCDAHVWHVCGRRRPFSTPTDQRSVNYTCSGHFA